MFTVALIGADGAGKTTVGRRLESSLPVPVHYIYMGINEDASNHMLLTTRVLRSLKRITGRAQNQGGPPDPERQAAKKRKLKHRLIAPFKSTVRLANRISDEWYRQSLGYFYRRRGHIVIFDRHYFTDYYAHDIAPTEQGQPSLGARLHGLMLARLYPKPDLVICLDAPGEVLFARKPEGTPELVERRRQEYLSLQDVLSPFKIVDASQPQEKVVLDVAQAILDHYADRTGHSAPLPSPGA